MTTFAEEKAVLGDTNAKDLHKYTHLQMGVDFLEAKTQLWLDNATELHGDVTDPDKKAELLTLRQTLINRLKAIL